MRAVQLHGIGDLRLDEVPEPRPGPREVLVRVEAAGVCRTDIEVHGGGHPDYVTGEAKTPITPGHEWSGVVVGVGEAVTRFAPGDEVTGETNIGCGDCEFCHAGHGNVCPYRVETGILNRHGAMRELHVHPEAYTHLLRGIPLEEGALIEPAAVGMWACEQAAITPKDRVAVLGGGSIGSVTMQAARAFGARLVMLTSRSPEKLALARQLGADAVVNAASQDVVAAAQEVTDGDFFDVVIECSGNILALTDALHIARTRARLVLLSVYDSTDIGENPTRIVSKELRLIGSCGSPNVWPATIDLIRRGAIQVQPLISARYPLGQFREAYEAVERGSPHLIKALIKPQQLPDT